ncbi:hypothetical protein MUO32_05245 [Shinella sp. CPCC 101442]|uniref:hypothetical protein n=1 Tax=Shinella sp. CPCC 101442 TaxID=2932265 RepID=UPI002152A36D|nr:hypothetical protein [Shinella sp. CPCC 101442]MCR6498431.1 hypothetical protein [Shinella sp. CPCC 101442]
MNQPSYHPELQCTVHGLAYDFASRTGTLAMGEMNCCDMAGTIAFFSRIDPLVKTIATIAGGRDDTTYQRRGTEWVAASPVN